MLHLITGGSSGLGYKIAEYILDDNSNNRVIVLCRNISKVKTLVDKYNKRLSVIQCDLSKKESILKSIKNIQSILKDQKISILINNAGIMGVPFAKTDDNFESHFGINVFGHFVLTKALLDCNLIDDKARIITISSEMSRLGKINFDNLEYDLTERRVNKWFAYSRSKLGNLIFVNGLYNYVQKQNKNILCISVHPGYIRTNITHSLRSATNINVFSRVFVMLADKFLAADINQGILSTIYAIKDNNIVNCDYIYPDKNFKNMKCKNKLNEFLNNQVNSLWQYLTDKMNNDNIKS